jgi:glycerate kinase
VVACDVDNPLYGERGAAYVFGPQKGATPEMAAALDGGLRRLAEIIYRTTGRAVAQAAGAGAAGGTAAALAGLFSATLTPGAPLVLDTLNIDSALSGVQLVITGEGKIDAQTLYGKAPFAVYQRAARCAAPIPTLMLAGAIADERQLYAAGITRLMALPSHPIPLEVAMRNASALLSAAAERALRLML